ncbi:MAG TPA: ATP phosphoribosyltransferase regulatory subunit, partial [Parvibaculum sp.]
MARIRSYFAANPRALTDACKLAGIPYSTAKDALKPHRNPRVDTLAALEATLPPDYDPDGEANAAAAKQGSGKDRSGAMRAVFEQARFQPVEPPLLQPADVFLDRSGEDIRRRLYVFTDPGGQELCLRPDLTIPTCRLYLDRNGGTGEARFCYSGAAFRFEPKGSAKPTEFVQTGAEFFGGKDADAADAEMLALAVEAVRAGGLKTFDIEMGDLALFDALVDALDIPSGWRTRLKRHFWRPAYFRELVERLAGNG